MNIRIVTHLSSNDPAEIKELVADFAESLLKRGFANDVEDNTQSLKSLIVVKENVEVLETAPEDFFGAELESALMTVIPTDTTKQENHSEENWENEGGSVDGTSREHSEN